MSTAEQSPNPIAATSTAVVVPVAYAAVAHALLVAGAREAMRNNQRSAQIAPLLDAFRAAADEYLSQRPMVVSDGPSAIGSDTAGPSEIGSRSPRSVGTAAAAARLGMTSRRVGQLCAEGALQASKAGRAWLVDAADLERFAQSRENR